MLINSLWSSSQRRLCAPNLEPLLCETSVALNVERERERGSEKEREVHWIASLWALWTSSPQTLIHCIMEDIARPFVHCPHTKAPVLYSQNLHGPFLEEKQRNVLLIWRHASCCKGRLLLLCQRSGYHTAVLWFALFLVKTLWKQNKKMDRLPQKQTGRLEKAEVKMSVRSYNSCLIRFYADLHLAQGPHVFPRAPSPMSSPRTLQQRLCEGCGRKTWRQGSIQRETASCVPQISSQVLGVGPVTFGCQEASSITKHTGGQCVYLCLWQCFIMKLKIWRESCWPRRKKWPFLHLMIILILARIAWLHAKLDASCCRLQPSSHRDRKLSNIKIKGAPRSLIRRETSFLRLNKLNKQRFFVFMTK